jgi:uncharacterized membrane protein required for colicin V production
MNYIDVIFIITALTGFFVGWKLRGVLMVVIPIAFLTGIFAANFGYQGLAEMLVKHIPTASKRLLISYVIIFLIASSIIVVMGVVLSRFFDFFNMAFIDRIFGAAILITVLIIPVFFLFTRLNGIDRLDFKGDTRKSLFYPYIKTYVGLIYKIPVLKHLDVIEKILK